MGIDILGIDIMGVDILGIDILALPRHEVALSCICENKDADQLRGNRIADQRLYFRYLDSTIHVPLLPKSKISSFYPSPVAVKPGLCQTWSECVPSIYVG